MDETLNVEAERQLRVQRMVRHRQGHHAALRANGLRAAAEGILAPGNDFTRGTVQECFLVAADRIEELEDAVRWALGELGDFEQRPEGAGAYWWRTELRQRAQMPNAPHKPRGENP